MNDPYYKKQIEYSLKGQDFKFDTSQMLFSTFEVDLGTQFLLRNMLDKLEQPTSILDLGCGSGVIGIVLARFFPQAQVILSDKDLLAVRYSRHNANLNHTTNVSVVGSVGIENVADHSYDLIISNIPAKVGDEAIEKDFILGPLGLLNPGCTYWFVVVNSLNRLIPSVGRRHELKLNEVTRRPGHTLYKLTKPA
jgi:16S rRNA G1207 methylase RsmC